ncbi:MAG: B12-binding domain-containing radical SAM protein [Betaproteobacteria bacterium]|nr:B12-binding domain-containing radical SAM protein [Betaproteobacteria bacterium]
MNVLLVYPRHPDTFWSFKHVLRFLGKRSAFPPLGLLTVAAMLPADWSLKLVDTNVEPLEDACIDWADWVMLSGMIVHKASAHEIAQRCAARGRPVIAGGPLFTTGHADFPEIPHFVLGEAEGVIAELVADLRRGSVRPEYRAASFPDLRATPVPRWDLIELRRYVTMPVQFSRGCPFDCEFCDIVAMYGRLPRTKAPQQVIAELESLRRAGWRDMVFIVDDNFIGHRKRVRELLGALVDWRARTRPQMGFLTEASVNLADEKDLLELMVRAGFRKVFVGLETPVVESLEECRKVQNSKRDLVGAVRAIQAAGLEVMGGFIVGFDSDPLDVFRRQFEFIQRAGVVTAMVGLLSALPQTRLYERLAREGRILADSVGDNTAAVLNFVPRLDRAQLHEGYRELMRSLYAPRNYYRRLRAFLSTWQPRGPRMRLNWPDLRAFLQSIWTLGVRQRGQLAFWGLFWGTLLARPRKLRAAMELAIMGHHFRTVAERL